MLVRESKSDRQIALSRFIIKEHAYAVMQDFMVVPINIQPTMIICPKTISYLNGIKKDLKNGQKGLEKTLTKSFIDLSVDIRLRSSLIKVVYHY
ncbi:MAG TPA: DUF3211 family protein [Candidatus Pelethosoma merdigallinarum]|nr:DUF3211 family protein [Candidatus Pelethosoma merdigallinarum]